ncbi:hypothetical protein FRB95_009368 [Tulasnella sp. JGI-2019a]|nr:hypothetical protein FRB95_009368 [Tulasnella sp. JGI-2019a]
MAANGPPARQILLRWVAPIVRPSSFNVSGILLATDALDGWSSDETLGLLRSLSGLEVMKLEDQEHQMDLILCELSYPTIHHDGAQVLLCPKLHTIHLNSCHYSRAAIVLELVEGRTEARGRKIEDPSSGWPTQLRGFKLPDGQSDLDSNHFNPR